MAVLAARCGTSGASENLIYAATFGDVEGVRAALRAGANTNAVDASRSSPLRAAAERGHLEVVKLLVDAGADLDLRPDSSWAGRGINPLSAAAQAGRDDDSLLPARICSSSPSSASYRSSFLPESSGWFLARKRNHGGFPHCLFPGPSESWR